MTAFVSRKPQGAHQIDDALANLGIADLHEGAVELEPFATIQKLEDEGFGVRLGHPAHCVTVARVRRFFEEELNGDVEDFRDLKQPARADAVHALLVFLHLLKCKSHALAETLLTHAEQHASQSHPAADVGVDGIRLLACHSLARN